MIIIVIAIILFFQMEFKKKPTIQKILITNLDLKITITSMEKNFKKKIIIIIILLINKLWKQIPITLQIKMCTKKKERRK